jgi:hypothetical protein
VGVWKVVVDDHFSKLTALPSHWCTYNSHDGTYGGNYSPAHVFVSGGYLHLLSRYESSGPRGAAWYQGAVALTRNGNGSCGGSPSPYPNSAVNSRLTIRMRLAETGHGTAAGHRNILRWPDSGSSSTGGEEDMWEGDVSTSTNGAYFHYGSGRIYHIFRSLSLTRWHTYRFERLNDVISVYIDDMTNPVYVYRGNSTTLPETVKHWVIQQQCPHAGCPAPSADTEDWQIAWITVENS